jgi:hypothetical protein
MKNRALIDLCCIFALGAVYWALIYLACTNDVLESLGVTPAVGQTFTQDFSFWAQIGWGVSVLAVLVWYVLGEWGLRATTMSSSGWMVLWVVLLLLVVGTGMTAVFLGPQATENSYWLGIFYVGGGLIFYWLTTMFFSPVSIKTIPPGSSLRRW